MEKVEARPNLPLCYLPTVIIAIPSMVLDFLLIGAFVKGSVNTFEFVVVHSMICSLLLVMAYACSKTKKDTRLPYLNVVAGYILGPLGTFGCLWVWLVEIYYRRKATSFEDWYASLFPEEEEEFKDQLIEKLENMKKSHGNTGLTPFMDIFAFGSIEQKQMAIALMAKNYHPIFASSLKHATRDRNNAVRVQAASAIAQIDNNMISQILKLEKQLKTEPDNDEVVLQIGQLYDDYAFTGLIDDTRKKEYLEKSLVAYIEYHKKNLENQGVIISIGRLYLRINQYEKARDWLKKHLYIGSEQPKIVFWYMESLYYLNDFKELREASNTFKDHEEYLEKFSPAIVDVVKLWSSQEKIYLDGLAS